MRVMIAPTTGDLEKLFRGDQPYTGKRLQANTTELKNKSRSSSRYACEVNSTQRAELSCCNRQDKVQDSPKDRGGVPVALRIVAPWRPDIVRKRTKITFLRSCLGAVAAPATGFVLRNRQRTPQSGRERRCVKTVNSMVEATPTTPDTWRGMERGGCPHKR
ncbi:hypothetical protein FA95DRAFT_1134127 [Auriscalpium vulgare]|uniref:Uncharacterized protein n=1 Tax=Auriscalpium vulgare TaxID=40419 RepID=A0ACB8RVH9_9AGAM|nr:hypothetical protein FA95DRAFT_1134127 [Auriscalpium vulgare]